MGNPWTRIFNVGNWDAILHHIPYATLKTTIPYSQADIPIRTTTPDLDTAFIRENKLPFAKKKINCKQNIEDEHDILIQHDTNETGQSISWDGLDLLKVSKCSKSLPK